MSGDGSVIPVRVAVRIRPLSKKEHGDGCNEALDKPLAGRPQVVFRNCNDKAFTYDYAYGPATKQHELFQEAVHPLVDQLFKGYNATVLAYGQTGSGKTFSMGTSYTEKESSASEVILGDNDGMIPRAVDLIFSRIKALGKNYEFKVRVAFVELYKETLYDLLSSKGKKEDCAVDLREDPKSGVKIVNLTEVNVENLSSTMRALEEGSNKRATAATAMNHTSSRSHAIFTLYIDGSSKAGLTNASNGEGALESGITVKFHLVDLAGSERAKKTHATGNRFKEGTAINMGLLSLGNVISALGEDTSSKHIPYRDSKLTRLLQDSLGGNSHTLMIACVSPADYNLEETLSTLRYADRARKIKNKPIINIDDKNELVARLRREIVELKIQVEQMNKGSSISGENEIMKAKQEADDAQNALIACQEEMGNMNEKLLISEASGEKMKAKLEELASEADSLVSCVTDSAVKDLIEKHCKRIHEVIDLHIENDKQLEEHESIRYSASILGKSKSNGRLSGNVECEYSDDMLDVTPRKKQSTSLANELACLNRELLQKEQLACSMKLNDEKLKEVKEKYESSMKAYEAEIVKLQKEKDDLNKQHRVDPKGKIAEQRRIKIQELEQQMADLKRKILEQQKAVKLNEQNEKKVIMLNDDIRSMKQAKIKLIRQMKVDADRMKVWKTNKEREVASLKQTERKQQVKMAKMETLHNKRQHVLQRKMEEAQMAKKRLEDIMKLRMSKAKLQAGKEKSQGFAGAVDRIREIVNHELDIVISIKDATQSKENLMEDRKDLTKQLKDIEKQARQTMTNDERIVMESKRKQIKMDLDARNLEIQNLQNQIMQIEETQRDASMSCVISGTAIGDKGKQWWDNIPTVTEAKLAIEHLFLKAADLMEQGGLKSSEMKELKSLYDEACTNSVNLENEIKQLKADHKQEINSVKKEYEEAQSFFLSKLTNPEECPAISEKDFNYLKEFQSRLENMMNGDNDSRYNKEKKKCNALRVTSSVDATVKTNEVEDYLKDQNASYTEDEDESDSSDDHRDTDWKQTPLFKRIKAVRSNIKKKSSDSNVLASKGKRKSSEDLENEDNESNSMKPPPTKRSLSGDSNCKCTTGCKNNRCSCVKGNLKCGGHCKCTIPCSNKEAVDQIKKSKDSTLNLNPAETTRDLINTTFEIPGEAKRNDESYMKNCKKSLLLDYQLTSENIVSALKTPKGEHRRATSIFPSPIADNSPLTDVSNSFSSKVKVSESCPEIS